MPELEAPDGYTPDPDASCGPAGAAVDLVPDNLLGVDISGSCSVHDFEYGADGGDRREADARFRRNMMLQVKERGGWLRPVRQLLAWGYWLAVRIWGPKSWKT